MEYLHSILNGLGNIVSNKDNPHTYLPTSSMDSFEELQYGGNDFRLNGLDQAQSPPVQRKQQQQQQPMYESDEAANRAFLNSYWLFMTNYYGRAPCFRSDLFCAMFPMDVLNASIDPDFPIRYWWMSIQHPMARILEENGAENEGTYDSGLYGICIIYRDECLELCMDWIVSLAEEDENKRGHLDVEARSAYSRDRDRLNPIRMLDDEDFDEDEHNAVTTTDEEEQGPQIIILDGGSEGNNTVVSKKVD